jgi:hypothetical protein
VHLSSSSHQLTGPRARSGVFDTPVEKCPPDRGSSDWVTDSPAPIFSGSPASRSPSPFSPVSFTSSINYPPTPPLDAADGRSDADLPSVPFGPRLGGVATPPLAIPNKHASPAAHTLPTPPFTPEDGPAASESAPASPVEDDALDFLGALFPAHAAAAFPHAKSVTIAGPALGAPITGVVLTLPDDLPTFYVDGKAAASVNLRER